MVMVMWNSFHVSFGRSEDSKKEERAEEVIG
jgi:hypothetical protein